MGRVVIEEIINSLSEQQAKDELIEALKTENETLKDQAVTQQLLIDNIMLEQLPMIIEMMTT